MGIREVIREEADWCTLDEVTGQGRGRIQYEEGHVKEMLVEVIVFVKANESINIQQLQTCCLRSIPCPCLGVMEVTNYKGTF